MIANLRDRLGENATLSKAAVPVSLALLVLATRWPFRTQYLFNWDAANFAFALQDFDVTSHAPHPPGYPYFVGLAKLFDLFLNDANASMVMESLLMSALGVAALFLLGKIMYSPQVGLIAALLLASSVTFWTYGEVALAYTALAPFSTLAALYTYKTIILGQNRLIPLVLCYAIAGGFRPSLLLFLSPLIAAACYRQTPRQVLLVAGICIGGFLLWFLPTAYLSGGLASYGAAFSAYLSQDVLEKYSPIHNGLGALLENFRDTAAYLFYSLYFSSLFLAGSMFLWLRRPRETFGRREIFILLWVSPMLLFYLFVHIGDPGYVFSVLPGILLLAARGCTLLPDSLAKGLRRDGILTLSVVLVLAANTGVFLFHQRPLTAWGLRSNDAVLESKIAFLQERGPPQQILALYYESFKQMQYYMPDGPVTAWIDVKSLMTQEVALAEDVNEVIAMDESLVEAASDMPGMEISLNSGAEIKIMSVEEGDGVLYQAPDLTIELQGVP